MFLTMADQKQQEQSTMWSMCNKILEKSHHISTERITTTGDETLKRDAHTAWWTSHVSLQDSSASTFDRNTDWEQTLLAKIKSEAIGPQLIWFSESMFPSWWLCQQIKLAHLGHWISIHWCASFSSSANRHCMVCSFGSCSVWTLCFSQNSQHQALCDSNWRSFYSFSPWFLWWKGYFMFMPDGARTHLTHAVFRVLHEHFGNRVLALHYPRHYDGLDWQAMSLDLNPCDLFLWDYFKDRVYWNWPEIVQEFKIKIGAIWPEYFQKIVSNFTVRLPELHHAAEQHFKDDVH